MLEGLRLKRGDLVVRYGRVLKITRINDGVLFLKPYFNAKHNQGGLTYSLLVKNIAMTNLRRAVSIKKLYKLLKKVLTEPNEDKQLLVLNMRGPLENNDLKETMRVVRTLWLERKANKGLLPNGKLGVYKQALEQLVEEVAVVCGLTLEKAKIKINSALKTIG